MIHNPSMPPPREEMEFKSHPNSHQQRQTTSSSSSGMGVLAVPPRSGSRNRGKQVGDWMLGKTLGAGSMGKVKLATNQFTKEKVRVGGWGGGMGDERRMEERFPLRTGFC